MYSMHGELGEAIGLVPKGSKFESYPLIIFSFLILKPSSFQHSKRLLFALKACDVQTSTFGEPSMKFV
mgnify:CR=1 FL=1